MPRLKKTTIQRIAELNRLADEAYDRDRMEYKRLSWRALKLASTGVEPTEAEAFEAFRGGY